MIVNKDFKVRENWDNDGVLFFENDKTMDLYKKLKYDLASKTYEGMFFAFSKEDFYRGYDKIKHLLKVMPDGSLEKVVRMGDTGGFCTHAAWEEWKKDIKEADERIKNECDPYEVYCYEYNNHEGCINYDGDEDALLIVYEYWGREGVDSISHRRFNKIYSIEEILERNERRTA